MGVVCLHVRYLIASTVQGGPSASIPAKAQPFALGRRLNTRGLGPTQLKLDIWTDPHALVSTEIQYVLFTVAKGLS